MENNNSRMGQWLSRIGEKLNEQGWYQQIKSKWDELDPQSRTYLQLATTAGAALLVMILVISSIISVRNLKRELGEKNDLLAQIQSANDEIRRLRESTPTAAQGGRPGETNGAPWATYFESTASSAGIEKSGLTVGDEKAGAAGDLAKESLFEIAVKHVNIKQIVRYAFSLENGPRPVKVRNLGIDTKADPTGYMDATLSLSAFTLKDKE